MACIAPSTASRSGRISDDRCQAIRARGERRGGNRGTSVNPVAHAGAAGTGALYISYDGVLEPLGQSQVLAYLEKLATDREIHLLSFEKAEDWHETKAREVVAGRIRAAGIHWHPRRYHSSSFIL